MCHIKSVTSKIDGSLCFKLEVMSDKNPQTIEVIPNIFFLGTNTALYTVFENHRKSLIQHFERSELRLHFEWTKVLILAFSLILGL